MSFDYIQTELTQAPTGVAGHMMLDISDNPYDLRPARDAMLWMTAQEKAKLKPNQKLVPIVGDTHNISSNAFLATMYISALHQIEQDNLLVTGERPYNIVDREKHVAAAFNAELISATSPYAYSLLYDTLWKRNVRTCFNDVAKSNGYVDMQNPEYQRIFETTRPSRFNELSATSQEGMYDRNKFMATYGLERAHQANDMIVQLTGALHIFGGMDGKDVHPYSEGLCLTYADNPLYDEAPPSVVPFVCLNEDESTNHSIIDNAKEHKGAALFIRGFDYSPFSRIGNFEIARKVNLVSLEQISVTKHWEASGGLEGTNIGQPKAFNFYHRDACVECRIAPQC